MQFANVFTRDFVTRENHWQIVILGNSCIIRYIVYDLFSVVDYIDYYPLHLSWLWLEK